MPQKFNAQPVGIGIALGAGLGVAAGAVIGAITGDVGRWIGFSSI